ncbi:MAG: hypothetical protein PF501_14730 [Salinisphaera sp.]|jgi:hypothetical protein|nr:hypothetical protein [Salinisphaera sp.]
MSEAQQHAAPAENDEEIAALLAEAEAIDPGDAGDAEAGEASEKPPGPTSAEALQMMLGPAFAIMAPNWGVQPAEIEALAQAWGDVADVYLPDGMTLGVELNAAIITLAIFAPRLSLPRNEKAARAKEEREAKRSGKEQAERSAKQAEKPDAANAPQFDLTGVSDDSQPRVEDEAIA